MFSWIIRGLWKIKDLRWYLCSWHRELITMRSATVIRTGDRWIYWNRTFPGLVMPNLVKHKINKKSRIIIILLGGHLLSPPGSSTLSLWSWSMCQMKHIFKIVIISKDQDLNLINCLIYEGMNLSDLKKMVSWMIF